MIEDDTSASASPSPSPSPTDMVTADDLANQLQFLLKTKWTIDKDTYNSDAFDQCEGAWPIAHPLPLPLWSNTIKQPFFVDDVSIINISLCKIYNTTQSLF